MIHPVSMSGMEKEITHVIFEDIVHYSYQSYGWKKDIPILNKGEKVIDYIQKSEYGIFSLTVPVDMLEELLLEISRTVLDSVTEYKEKQESR